MGGRERERERETTNGREKDQKGTRERPRKEERKERGSERGRKADGGESETPRKGSENVLIKKGASHERERESGKKKNPFTPGRNSPVPTSYLMSLERKRSSLPLSRSLSGDRQLSLQSPVVGAPCRAGQMDEEGEASSPDARHYRRGEVTTRHRRLYSPELTEWGLI